MSHPLVVNVRSGALYDVYVGRRNARYHLAASIWANPYRANEDHDRQSIIRLYRQRLLASPELLARLPELRGLRLACWCAPLDCHADVLAEMANAQVPA